MSVVVVILQQHSGKNSSISLNFFCPFNTSTELKVGSYSYSALETGGLCILLCLVMGDMMSFLKLSLREKKNPNWKGHSHVMGKCKKSSKQTKPLS